MMEVPLRHQIFLQLLMGFTDGICSSHKCRCTESLWQHRSRKREITRRIRASLEISQICYGQLYNRQPRHRLLRRSQQLPQDLTLLLLLRRLRALMPKHMLLLRVLIPPQIESLHRQYPSSLSHLESKP